MRHVICAAGIILCGLLPALSGADLTVILDFESGHSERATGAMRLEAEKLLKDSGVSLDWRMRASLSPHESFSHLAVVKLKGHCEMSPYLDGSGDLSAPLGITYRMDGRVIPFSEVQCDEVRSALRDAHLPPGPDLRELLYGRALGRVLAHELLHVVNRSGHHARQGVTQKYFSASTLVGDHVD